MNKLTLENGTEVQLSKESYDELVKAVQTKRFVPKERYWRVSSYGTVGEYYWINDYEDNFQLNLGNCFETRVEAETQLQKLHAIADVTKYIYNNDLQVDNIDWNDEKYKYNFYYDYISNKIGVDCYSEYKVYSLIPYLKSREACEQLVKDRKEALTLIYK